MHDIAQQYRIDLYRETQHALEIGAIDSQWKINLFKALTEIKTDLPIDVSRSILDEHFKELNEKLTAQGYGNPAKT